MQPVVLRRRSGGTSKAARFVKGGEALARRPDQESMHLHLSTYVNHRYKKQLSVWKDSPKFWSSRPDDLTGT